MLFGNRDELGIELEPVTPNWESRYRPESVGWAGLSLWVGGRNTCRHIVGGSDRVQERIYVPLAPIADWFVSSWAALSFEENPHGWARSGALREAGSISLQRDWRNAKRPSGCGEEQWEDARYEWWERHFLLGGAEGSHLPNLSFLRQDEWLWIEAGPVTHAGDHPPRFIEDDASSVVLWQRASSAIEEFVSYVGKILVEAELEELFPWCSVEDPLSPIRLPPHQALQLFTGRTITELCAAAGVADEAQIERALDLRESHNPASSPATQVLRDLSPSRSATFRQLQKLLRTVLSRTRGQPARALVPARRDCRSLASTLISPEEAGYQAAREIRSRCKLNGAPVDKIEELCRELGVRVERRRESLGADRMVVGSGEDHSAWIAVLETPRTRVEHAYRFEVARGLGHLFLDAETKGVVGAASSPYAQEYRRRRSGAFAAELLLPSEVLAKETALQSESPDLEAFRRILDRFGVGKTMGAYHLWNHNLLASQDARDDLLGS